MENNSDVNICSLSDSYKFGHWDMLPPNTNKVYSYFESRTGAKYNNTVFFGLQYILKKRGWRDNIKPYNWREFQVNQHYIVK